MDTLYIGDIPTEYKYAVFGNDYITLYNKPTAQNETLPYYRIYTNYDNFMYSTGTTDFRYNNYDFTEISVSNNWLYRTDIDKIFIVTFLFILLFIFVFNIVTSVFKKGGVFGGLL